MKRSSASGGADSNARSTTLKGAASIRPSNEPKRITQAMGDEPRRILARAVNAIVKAIIMDSNLIALTQALELHAEEDIERMTDDEIRDAVFYHLEVSAYEMESVIQALAHLGEVCRLLGFCVPVAPPLQNR